MPDSFYVAKTAKVKCSFGTKENKLKVGPSHHGAYIVNGSKANQLLNMMDNKVSLIIPDFGNCNCPLNPEFIAQNPSPQQQAAKISANSASGMKLGLCACHPLTPAPWLLPNLKASLDGKPALIKDSKIICAKAAGIITITEASKRPVGVTTSNLSASGKDLTAVQKKALNKFRGDQFKPESSFNGSLTSDQLDRYTAANLETTCKINVNLKGREGSGTDHYIKEVSAETSATLAEMQTLRNGVSPVTPNTIMQKVIPENAVNNYLSNAWGPKIGNCVTKASDAAPYTSSSSEVYENLRLDYTGTPYDKTTKSNGDVFIMRYTSNDVPGNADIPKIANNAPPCTGTGFTGSDNTMIPEYAVDPMVTMTDAAIFKIDSDGNEVMVGYFDKKKNKFRKVV